MEKDKLVSFWDEDEFRVKTEKEKIKERIAKMEEMVEKRAEKDKKRKEEEKAKKEKKKQEANKKEKKVVGKEAKIGEEKKALEEAKVEKREEKREEKLKESKEMVEKALKEKAMEAREQRLRMERVKEKVKEFEKENKSRIVVFRSTRNWWKMGGNSALIYVYRIAPRLGKEVNLMNDTDFFAVFKTGVVSIPSIEDLEKDLSRLGIKLERQDADTKVFKLIRELEKAEITKLKKLERAKIDKVNQIIVAKEEMMNLELWREILELEKIVLEVGPKIKPTLKKLFMPDLVNNMRSIGLGYLTMVDEGKMEITVLQMRKIVRRMLNDVRIMVNQRLVGADQGARLAESLGKIQKILKDEI